MSDLARSLLHTIIYFDMFRFAPTIDDLARARIVCGGNRHDDSRNMPEDILGELKSLVDQNRLENKDGFYFLPGREYLAPLRLKHERISVLKWRRLKRHLFFLCFIPWLRGVIVFGSLAFRNTSELSDLDIFCVTSPRRVWLTRLCVHGILFLLNVRRSKQDIIAPNKVCPNHFVGTDSLKIPFENIYNAMTYSNGIVVLDRLGGLATKFSIENGWINGYVEGSKKMRSAAVLSTNPFFLGENIINLLRLGDALENVAKKFQLYFMGQKGLGELNKRETRVCDLFIALHDTGRESEFLELFFMRSRDLR